MEKHPQHTGKPRPPRDRNDVQPEPPSRADLPVPPERDGIPQNDRKKIRNRGAQKVEEAPAIREDKPNRADFHHGSTTQAGSDYGQGSNDLPD